MVNKKSRLIKHKKNNKPASRKERSQIILIFEGGKNNKTEYNYFSMIHNQIRSSKILKLDTQGHSTDLSGMFRRAKQLTSAETFYPGDHIYILVDLDHNPHDWKKKLEFLPTDLLEPGRSETDRKNDNKLPTVKDDLQAETKSQTA